MGKLVSLHGNKSSMTDLLLFKSLVEAYLKYHVPVKRSKTAVNEASKVRKWILPLLGDVPIANVTPLLLTQVHAAISVDSPVQANRVIQSLRTVYTRAESLGFPGLGNPAAQVALNRERPRERLLSGEEKQALLTAVNAYPNVYIQAAIKVLMLTGCRKNEILRAKWCWLNTSRRVLRIPDTKNGQPLDVHLCELAFEIIQGLEKKSQYIFPSRRDCAKPTADIKKAWSIICEQAGVEDAHIHDCRHAFISTMAEMGAPIAVIARSVGHRSLRSTQRYIHVNDDSVASAVDALGAIYFCQNS